MRQYTKTLWIALLAIGVAGIGLSILTPARANHSVASLLIVVGLVGIIVMVIDTATRSTKGQ